MQRREGFSYAGRQAMTIFIYSLYVAVTGQDGQEIETQGACTAILGTRMRSVGMPKSEARLRTRKCLSKKSSIETSIPKESTI